MGNLVKILITPVDFDCNMECGYCYNGCFRKSVTASSKVINMSIIYRIFDQFAEFLKGDRLVVIWHGGEPLLAGMEFYKEAIKTQTLAARNRYKITNCLQTNGTLVNEKWAELFSKLHIGPSVSIDGPKWLHDKIRQFIGGDGTYIRAMNGYRLFQQMDINTGMLMVISKLNVNHAKEIWEWVLDEKIPHFDFLPCIEPELWRQGKQKYGLTSDEVAKFNIEFFNLWFKNADPNIKIRTFRDAVKGQLGGHVNICSWKAGCLQHISFDSSGNTFPCARYHCYPETNMGNINQMSFAEIMASKTTKFVYQGIARGQEKCRPCKWNQICGSGCPFLKYALHGTWDAPYIHCQSRQALFNHVQRIIYANV